MRQSFNDSILLDHQICDINGFTFCFTKQYLYILLIAKYLHLQSATTFNSFLLLLPPRFHLLRARHIIPFIQHMDLASLFQYRISAAAPLALDKERGVIIAPGARDVLSYW